MDQWFSLYLSLSDLFGGCRDLERPFGSDPQLTCTDSGFTSCYHTGRRDKLPAQSIKSYCGGKMCFTNKSHAKHTSIDKTR
jgi:hypothetical protein